VLFKELVDAGAVAARLRETDPWRMRAMLAATDGFLAAVGSTHAPLPASDTARVCAGCGARDAPQAKLRCCSGCGLVLYCGYEPLCQRSHWRQHKPECRRAKTRGAR
jgi:hypothetical protein